MLDPAIVSPGNPAESAIAKKIASRAAERGTVFVFPTQASADSWAEAALKTRSGALETDRFLGWDSFIDRITQKNIPADKRKSDARSRLIWALRALKEQEERPFLRSLLKPGLSPPRSFAPRLAALAPSLNDLVSYLTGLPPERSSSLGQALIDDYTALARHYAVFLDDARCYEPGHLKPAEDKAHHFIFFGASLMPGYETRAAELARLVSIELFSEAENLEARRQNDKRPLLLKFANVKDELLSVLSACAWLLDQGAEPGDISISLPELSPEIRAYIGAFARQYALPLDFRAGDPLAASSFGQLLFSLSRAASEGFSLRTLRGLFDRRAFRWKDATAALNLLHYASRCNIPEFSADRRYMAELWAKTFSLCRPPESGAAAFYASLSRAADSLAGARSFPALRRALYGFRETFLDESELPAAASRRLERVFEELDALERWQDLLGTQESAAGPFETFLLSLEGTRYRQADSANAISVYPYHIGMLTAAPLHFVLEAFQDALEPAKNYFSRIPEEMRPDTGEADISEALLSSFASVKAVYCHADQGLSGYSVPHPYFAQKGAASLRIGGALLPFSPDSGEIRAWRAQEPADLPAILPSSRIGAALDFLGGGLINRATSAGLTPRSGQKAALSPLDSVLLLNFPSCDAAPLYKISPAQLKNFIQCPFKWFLSCAPGFDASASAAALLAEGSLTHALIHELLRAIADRDGTFSPGRIDVYMEWLDAFFGSALSQTLRDSGPALAPALESAYPKIRDRIKRVLDYEKAFSEAGWDIGIFETPLARPYAELGLSFQGRADRISQRPAGAEAAAQAPTDADCEYAVIDYKKGKTPRKSEFLTDKDGTLRDLQIAGYADMLEGEGKTVALGMYWSIENSKETIVFGQGGARPDRKAFGAESAFLSRALESASEALKDGRFLSITPSVEACARCSFRAVCRAHFSSERL